MQEQRTPPAGAIDSLGLGFALAARRPYLALLPLGLAVVLMLLPSWTAPAQGERVLGTLGHTLLSRVTTPDQALDLSLQINGLAKAVAQANLLRLVAWQVPILSLSGRGATWVWEDGLLSLVGFLGGLALAGLLLGACYLAPVGIAVAGQRRPLARAILKGWLALVGYRLLLGGVGAVGLLLAALLVAVAMLISPVLASFFVGLLVGAIFLVLFYLFLVEEAVFVEGVGPIEAVLRSVRVVFSNFWPCLRFWLLTAILSVGLRILLERITGSLPGAVVASALYAFIATGITGAGMVFYKERAVRLTAP